MGVLVHAWFVAPARIRPGRPGCRAATRGTCRRSGNCDEAGPLIAISLAGRVAACGSFDELMRDAQCWMLCLCLVARADRRHREAAPRLRVDIHSSRRLPCHATMLTGLAMCPWRWWCRLPSSASCARQESWPTAAGRGGRRICAHKRHARSAWPVSLGCAPLPSPYSQPARCRTARQPRFGARPLALRLRNLGRAAIRAMAGPSFRLPGRLELEKSVSTLGRR
ncbi:hypothetical protein DFH27DRAFT_24691 [Peziza echinospora]|nr:hypothetical protein DFH27DRAFT_24691 [Peziza echinospora]